VNGALGWSAVSRAKEENKHAFEIVIILNLQMVDSFVLVLSIKRDFVQLKSAPVS